MGKRVLVIEDFEVIQRLVEVILSAAGIDVVTRADGITGLAAALDDPPDLLVLDIALPRMSGWDLLDHLNDIMPDRAFPILVLTAHAAESDRRRAYEAGVEAFMPKPFRPDDLRRVVTRMLDDSSAPILSPTTGSEEGPLIATA